MNVRVLALITDCPVAALTLSPSSHSRSRRKKKGMNLWRGFRLWAYSAKFCRLKVGAVSKDMFGSLAHELIFRVHTRRYPVVDRVPPEEPATSLCALGAWRPTQAPLLLHPRL